MEKILKNQMDIRNQKRRDSEMNNRNFKEHHKIFDNRNALSVYRHLCNRKVPINKINNLMTSYKKSKQ